MIKNKIKMFIKYINILKMSLFLFDNDDKDEWMKTENWKCKYNPSNPASILNIPISRMLLLGPSGVGKTNVIKNFIAHQTPEYDRILCIHHDENTREYDDVKGPDFTLTTEIPPVSYFDEEDESEDEGMLKHLVILDDVFTKKLSREGEKNFNKLITYCSTHRYCQVIVSVQDYTMVAPDIRRNINIFCLWKIHDKISQKLLTKKLGLSDIGLYKIFSGSDPIIKNKHDFLMYDMLPNAPLSKFRINGIIPINPETIDVDDDIEEKLERKKRKNIKEDPNVLTFTRK